MLGKMIRIYIPENEIIEEMGYYYDVDAIVDLLRKYKNNPEAIQFIADMMEE